MATRRPGTVAAVNDAANTERGDLESPNWGTVIPGTGGPVTYAGDNEPDDEPDEPESPLDRIAMFLGTTAADARAEVRVWRIKDGNSHKLAWCKDYPAKEFEDGGDLELIRREWGPGEYQLRLYGVRGGRFGMVTKEDVEIVAGVTAPNPVQQNSELAGVLKSLTDNQAAMMQALTQRPDPMAQMGPVLALMAQMRQVFGPTEAPVAPKSNLSEIVSAIRELREVSSEINPPPPEPDTTGGLLPMAGQIMELVKMNMDARNTQQVQPLPMIEAPPALSFPPVVRAPVVQATPAAPPAPIAPQATLPGIEPEGPAVTPVPPPDAAQVIEALRTELLNVVAIAAAGGPVSQGAEILYEKLPDEIIDLLTTPAWFDLLYQFEPACKPHEAWFREAHKLVLDMLAEDAAEDAAEAAAIQPGLIPPA